PSALVCMQVRGHANEVVELPVGGSGERVRWIAPANLSLCELHPTAQGTMIAMQSREKHLALLDLERPAAGFRAVGSGGATDFAPVGWTPSGALIFGANVRGHRQIMALGRDGAVEVLRLGHEDDVPLAVAGDAILFARLAGGAELFAPGFLETN